MKRVSLVIPFIDQLDITKRCIEVAVKNAGADFQLLLIDNGSDIKNHKAVSDFAMKMLEAGKKQVGTMKTNPENIGVLQTFKQGFEEAEGDIIGFIHNDVLLHEENWVQRVSDAFESTHRLGLIGIFGAVGVGDNGGRIRSQSKMLGLEWGKCECHEVAWQHHSEFMDGLAPAAILDGVGMFFSREAANSLLRTDMFDSWRAPHHFYDRIIPLKLIDRNYKIGTLGLGFDHWSGATANSSDKYAETCRKWLEETGNFVEGAPMDQQVYNIAEQQFFKEFAHRLPCYVHADWSYEWRGLV